MRNVPLASGWVLPLAVLTIAVASARPSVAAPMTGAAVRNVARAPSVLGTGTLVPDPPGFTIGGRLVPWGGSVTISRADVS